MEQWIVGGGGMVREVGGDGGIHWRQLDLWLASKQSARD